MSFNLQPKTDAGRAVVAAAQTHIDDFQARAADADRENVMPKANYDDLIASRVAAAFVPEELGGFGLQSVYDWITTIVTLARGDASTAIALNMHLGITRGMALGFYAADKDTPLATRLAEPLQDVVRGDMLICATATEPGTDNLHPLTEAEADGENWRINGRKIFVTMSPLATHLGMNLRMRDAQGDHLVTTLVPMDTPGLVPQNDWDALGMRGSGSQAVVFNDMLVPKTAIRKLGPWGEWSVGVVLNRAVGNLPLVGAFLGVAEAAHAMVLDRLATQTRVNKPVAQSAGIQTLVGEMEIELAKCRAILSAAATRMDEYLDQVEKPDLASAHELMKDYQTAKWVVNRGAIDIVSKAMDLMGGAGYTNSHPLARLYRDVRAGPFMQPFAPSEARQYVGQVVLGQPPQV